MSRTSDSSLAPLDSSASLRYHSGETASEETIAMETIPPTEDKIPDTTTDEVITSPLIPDLVIRRVPKEVLERLRAEIPVLRAHREAILARRGGKPFSEEEITGALHEARAAHERGE
jgi:hypothetical protein